MFLVAAVAALTAQAQDFHFIVRGEEVPAGTVMNITSMMEPSGISYKIDPKLQIKADKSGPIVATVTNVKSVCTPEFDEIEWLTGAKLTPQFCGICPPCIGIPAGDSLTKNGELTAGVPVDMEVDYGVELGDEQNFDDVSLDGECTVKCTFGGKDYLLTFTVKKEAASVGNITIDNNAPIEYYDLQGRQISNPSQGLYIVRQGAKVSKQIIK